MKLFSKSFVYGYIACFAAGCLVSLVIDICTKSSDSGFRAPCELFFIDDVSFVEDSIIEKEYFKRNSPEDIINAVLNDYSMGGTVIENIWNSLSYREKIGILLKDSL